MHASLVCQVSYSGRVQLFSETDSGALDYEGCFGKEEADERAGESLGRPVGPFNDELSRRYDRDRGLFLAAKDGAELRLIGQSPCCGPKQDPAADAFFIRYPDLVDAMAWGELATAARMIRRSRKLAPFYRLVGHIYGERMALAFALLWLCEGADEKYFDVLINRDGAYSLPRDPAFELALPFIRSVCGHDYRIEAANLLRSELERGRSIVLPVVGSRHRPCLGELASLAAAARSEAQVRSLVDGTDPAPADERIDRYLESIAVFLEPEPRNPADRNAVAVIMRRPGGRDLEQAGYLQREIAAVLAPDLAEDPGLYAARLFRLSEEGADISISLPGCDESALRDRETAV
jgi:hypothetical protein